MRAASEATGRTVLPDGELTVQLSHRNGKVRRRTMRGGQSSGQHEVMSYVTHPTIENSQETHLMPGEP